MLLLLPAIVTHTHNTSERSCSHRDVYKRFLLVSLVTSQSNIFLHPKILGFTSESWDLFGISWDIFGMSGEVFQKFPIFLGCF